MKQFTSLVICLVFAFVVVGLTSCKKDEVEAPSIQGYWEGKYGDASGYPSIFFAFVIKSDGTAEVYSGGADTASSAKGKGNYTFLDNKLNLTYNYSGSNVFNATATTTSAFTMIEGTWGTGASYSNGGKFFMGKN